MPPELFEHPFFHVRLYSLSVQASMCHPNFFVFLFLFETTWSIVSAQASLETGLAVGQAKLIEKDLFDYRRGDWQTAFTLRGVDT